MPGVSTRAHGGYVDRQSREIGRLSGSEVWWRDHYDDIKSRGYQLHPRYDPRWVSSWRGSSSDFSVEAEQPYLSLATMDATRLRDGKRVMLKKVLPEEGPHELQICLLFSSAEVATNPHNHCVPLLDVIELSSGSQKLMVFPLLFPFNQPRIRTFGEFAAFFTQICEGIQCMHRLNVAHRDCTAENIMSSQSKMYPNRFLPAEIGRHRTFKGAVKAYTRARPPPRYYFVGLELSVQYPSRDTIDEPWRRGDTSAPEHQSGGLGRCNPFQTDIYYIGNLVSQEFVEKCEGFEFMKDLVASMTQDDPAKRPLIEDVLQEFVRIRESLTKSKLRSAITSKDVPKVFGIIRQTRQSVRAVWHIVAGRPAIPYL